MKAWLLERWTDPAKFAATMRGLGVLAGQAVLAAAPEIAAATGWSREVVLGLGVLLTGGSAGIRAGDSLPK